MQLIAVLTSTALALMVLMFTLIGGGCGRQQDDRPNIVLVILDTVRSDFTGDGDGGTGLTPYLDGLAAEGTLFPNTWSNAPWTVPSHASLFTGLLPSEHGCTAQHPKLDTASSTLAELLAGAGYATAGFYSNPWLSERAADLLRGFDHQKETMLKGFFNSTNRYPEGDQGGRSSSTHIARWLKERPARKPFFLFVNYLESHLPYDPPADYRRRNLPDLSPDDWISVLWGHEFNAQKYDSTRVDWRLIHRLYAGDVNTADRLLGNLLRLLKQADLYENTILIVTADHGENLGDHDLAEHQFSVHETLLRVPLVIRAPGRLAAGTREDPAMLIDLFPTILEFAGISAEQKAASGRSLLSPPDPATASDRPLVAEYAGPPAGLLRALRQINPRLDTKPLGASFRTIRVGDLRLTVGSEGTVELHDLAADPGQRHDLSAERPRDLEALQETLGKQPYGGWLLREGKVEMDEDTRQRLRALGYVH